MFDIDLRIYTGVDKYIIDCNANFLPNWFIREIDGSKEAIAQSLLEGKLLEKVEIDTSKKKIIFSSAFDDYIFVREILPILSGGESLVYHGSLESHLHDGTEIFDLSANKKEILISRRLSIEHSDNSCDYDDYFNSINNHLLGCIASLNEAIDDHNEELINEANACAENLSNWYKAHPEQFK